MNTTFKLELNSKPKTDKTHGILIRISQNRKHKRISSGIFIKKSDFNKNAKHGCWIRTSNSEHAILNKKLKEKLISAEDDLTKLQKEVKHPSLVAIKARMKGEFNDFFAFADKKVEMLKEAGTISTYKKHKSVIQKLKEFNKEKELSFDDISVTFLTDLNHHYIRLGNKVNTRHSNFKTIRSIFYQAIKEGLFSQEKNPFFIYKLKTEEGSKEKLTVNEIKKIEELNLEYNSLIWHTKNYFLFSFYSAGMRVGDLIQLEWVNIVNDRLEYKMNKTGSLISLKIHAKSLKILNHYREGKPKKEGYIFPILSNSIDMKNPLAKHKEISRCEASLNKYLKQIAKKAEIKKGISMHVARHSFASIAKNLGTDLQKISELLRHSSKGITEAYLNPFPSTDLDSTLDQILDY